ncbi:Uncharacterised protein [Vibrio cholerae]|nr:Uncharacterised protein [Vibrio cholerae]
MHSLLRLTEYFNCSIACAVTISRTRKMPRRETAVTISVHVMFRRLNTTEFATRITIAESPGSSIKQSATSDMDVDSAKHRR